MGYSWKDLLTIIDALVRSLFTARIFEIERNLYQSGNLDAHFAWIAIKTAKIDGITDLEGGRDSSRVLKEVKDYAYIPIWDGPLPDKETMDKLWERAKYVNKLRSAGWKMLGHCGGGVNRASLFNGMVLNLMGYKGRAIVKRIRKERPGALTNPEFTRYLESLT